MIDPFHRPPITILLVDDDIAVRTATAYLLNRKGGFQVVEASGAEEALTYLTRDPGIRIVVTETRIAGAPNGFDLARSMHQRWPHLRTIITSHAPAPGPDEVPGGSIFLRKPYRSEALVQAIMSLLDRTGGP